MLPMEVLQPPFDFVKVTLPPDNNIFMSLTASAIDHALISTPFATGSKKGKPVTIATDAAIADTCSIFSLSVMRYAIFIPVFAKTIFSTTDARFSLSLSFPEITYSSSYFNTVFFPGLL